VSLFTFPAQPTTGYFRSAFVPLCPATIHGFWRILQSRIACKLLNYGYTDFDTIEVRSSSLFVPYYVFNNSQLKDCGLSVAQSLE